MKSFKRILLLSLAVVMVVGIMPLVSAAAEAQKSESEVYADVLFALGAFRGTEAGYELERIPTRIEASVMLVRLLGKETEALASNAPHPFDDVPGWAQGYVSYMYEKGLTKGVSSTKFGSSSECDSKMYVTFVLRALGFDDSKGDFSYEEALTHGRMNKLLTGDDALRYTEKGFTRGEMATVSYNALFVSLKNSDKILLQKLDEENAVNKTAAKKILDTIEADDLIALANYNTGNYPYFDLTTKMQTGYAVTGYPSQTIVMDSQAKGQDLDSNPKVSYHFTFTSPDGKKLTSESYITDGYEYTKDLDGNRIKKKFELQNDGSDDDPDAVLNILEKYANVKMDKSSDGSLKITLTYANNSIAAVNTAKSSAGFWFNLDEMKETQYTILCKKFEKTYNINAEGELISEGEAVELSYVEDGDSDTYTITRTTNMTYNNIGKPVTVTLPGDLSSYKEIKD